MYRDEYERCPRCTVELIDTGAIRSCTTCRGQWATQAVLLEMAIEMTTPDWPQLRFVPDPGRAQLACPSCSTAMGTWKLAVPPESRSRATATLVEAGLVRAWIELDRCERHGVWFDRDELGHVLMAVFEDNRRRSQDAEP